MVWQSRNKVEIPNDGTATRFSLKELVGGGPWPGGRIYFAWFHSAIISTSHRWGDR